MNKKILQILKKGFNLPLIGEIRYYYLLIIFLLIFYIISKELIIGIAAGLSLIFFFLFEVYEGILNQGIKKEIKELLLAILIAGFVWYGLGFVLKTSSPINAIASCSMLPDYERGDLIIISGDKINTKIYNYPDSINKIILNPEIYYNNTKLNISVSIYVYCLENKDSICYLFKQTPYLFYEKYGPIKLQYDYCKKYNTKTKTYFYVPCIKNSTYNDEEIVFNKNYDLIVYKPKPTDLFSAVGGDIIHRAVFAINATDGIYYFTKGDNNPIYDFQYFSSLINKKNSPVSLNQIIGKAILKIPYIGNIKVVITPQVLFLSDEQTACDNYFIEE
jgi:hypothetical protein